jgi:hypothetical protein
MPFHSRHFDIDVQYAQQQRAHAPKLSHLTRVLRASRENGARRARMAPLSTYAFFEFSSFSIVAAARPTREEYGEKARR